jgi:hypothetical protein
MVDSRKASNRLWVEGMKVSLGTAVRGVSFFLSVVSTEVSFFAVRLYARPPFAGFLVPRNARYAGFIPDHDAAILHVLPRRAGSKIFNSVIISNAVGMVDIFIGPRSVVQKPDHAVFPKVTAHEPAPSVSVSRFVAPSASKGNSRPANFPIKRAVSVFEGCLQLLGKLFIGKSVALHRMLHMRSRGRRSSARNAPGVNIYSGWVAKVQR